MQDGITEGERAEPPFHVCLAKLVWCFWVLENVPPAMFRGDYGLVSQEGD